MIDLTVFCKDDANWSKFDLNSPFIKDGYKYATNRFAIVRLKASVGSLDSKRLTPDVAKYFEGEYPPVKAYVDSDIEHSVGNCPKCEGEGDVRDNCHQCGGEGRCECDCGDEHECCICDGTGKAGEDRVECKECKECKGTGDLHVWGDVAIDDHKYAGKFMSLLKENLPLFSPIGIRDGILKFTFDGGEGVLLNVL